MSLPHVELIEDQQRSSILMANSWFSDPIPSVDQGRGDGTIFDIPKSYLDMLAAQGSGGASSLDMQTIPEALIAQSETPDMLGMVNFSTSILSSTSSSNDDQELVDNKLLEVKTNLRKQGEPRFVFFTKTEVDCLDDGYRWRKYGRQHIKDNPHPRSYYRCTSESTCRVKKMTERSLEDPLTLVTTYEGTHTHPCPMTRPKISPERSTYRSRAATLFASSFRTPQVHHHQQPPQLPFYNQTGSSRLNLTNINTINVVPSLHSYHPQERQYYPSPLPYSLHKGHGLAPQDTSISHLLQEGQYFPSPLQYSVYNDHELLPYISYSNQVQEEQYFLSPLSSSMHGEPRLLQDTSYSHLLQEGHLCPSLSPFSVHREPRLLQTTSNSYIFQEGQHCASPLPYSEPRDEGLLQDIIRPFLVGNGEPSEGSLGNPPRVSF